MAKRRTGRWRVLVAFTLAYAGVFGGLFYWFDRFSTGAAVDRLRDDLRGIANGAAAGVDAGELVALYRDGQPNAAGFSDDARYLRQLAWFQTVHTLNPQAWPYTFVRGDRPDTRRLPGAESIADVEFVYLVDLNARAGYDASKAAKFLDNDHGSEAALQAWARGEVVERPGLYDDRWGRWMTDYAPVKEARGEVVALVGVDFDAAYVSDVQARVRHEMLLIFVGAYVLLTALGLYAYRARYLRGMFGRYASLSLLRDVALLELGYASRRRVTVLFIDINEFSTICERHTADEVIGMLNRYFETMSEIIVAGGGWLKQFVGDEIMVIYNAPDDHASPERAAVETALEMVRKLRVQKAATTAPGFFEVKIGIHSGDVIVGNVGSRHRTEYAAVGDDVNLGSRIMGMSKDLASPILISSVTHAAVKDLGLPRVAYVDRGLHPVKGRFTRVQVYEVRDEDAR